MQVQSSSTYMAPRTAKMFLNNLTKYFNGREGKALAKTLRELYIEGLYTNLSAENWNVAIKSNDFQKGTSAWEKQIVSDFVKVAELIKDYQIHRRSKKWQTAFDIHLKIVIRCLQIAKNIKEPSFHWLLRGLRIILMASKKIFFQSMKHLTTTSKLKNDLVNHINRFKSQGRLMTEEVRQQIVPLIDNMQVSIMFNLHNYEVIRIIIHTSKLLQSSQRRFQDHFLFLKGKYALVTENFKEAEKCFSMINIVTQGQKRLVLKYLIPCKIFLGKMFEPTEGRADEVFPEYQTLIRALRSSSFKEFDQTVQKYQKVWIKRGIYLLMDRLRVIIWRNLIKRVYTVLGEKIMMEQIEKAVALAGGEETLNECICIVGNLIYEGYIKGFIFQNETIRGLVLRKKEGVSPFPKLADIAN